MARSFRLRKVVAHLTERAYTKIAPLTAECFVTSEPVDFSDRTVGKHIKEVKVGTVWATNVFDCAWFHVTGEIPAEYATNPDIVFLLDLGGEGLVYDNKLNARQGITCYASEFSRRLGKPHRKVVIDEGLSHEGKVDFYVDAAANDLFGRIQQNSRVAELSIAKRNNNIRTLAYDVDALMHVYEHGGDANFRARVHAVLRHLAGVYRHVTEEQAGYLIKELSPLLTTKNERSDVMRYTAIGHSHIDLAWLWPIRETLRKGARTFTTQMLNLARYPDYIFGASQAQLYDWVKAKYPQIYADVKKQIEAGRWDVQGATWVEPDSNLISGESLIRQFYYGKKFFLDEFNLDMEIFWVPDSFGYSACIPQVMKLSGCRYFLTQKMSWNTVNEFPHHTFNWTGLDGSTVFAHMLPESTYNGPMRGDMLTFGEKNFKQRNISNRAISLFGIGDGGGGPGFEHLERLARYRDLCGMPQVEPGKALDFFREIDDGKTPYPTHSGELYLEKHQGTATTQSRVKYYNRKCEFLLRNYELLAVIALKQNLALPISLPDLAVIWKEILLYQFHDILPGSSIDRVYEECVARYEIIHDRLAGAVSTLCDLVTAGSGLLNLNSYPYVRTANVGGSWYKVSVPAMSVWCPKEEDLIEHTFARTGEDFIQNDKVKVKFMDGYITSIATSDGTEYVQKGRIANRFRTYRDIGDCWDLTRHYRFFGSNVHAHSVTFETDGPTATATVSYKFGESRITQTVSITDGSPLITFDTSVAWGEDKTMLRVDFPTAISSDVVNFNVQFGHIARRTTHANKVERAQFEVSGQKFADISDNTHGLSLITESKYGFRCWDGVLDLNLIRSPKKGPGTKVDHGTHRIRYALFPHNGALSSSTYAEAYLFNNPLISVRGTGTASTFATIDNNNVVIETVKVADNGGVVVRLYNSTATEQKVTVTVPSFTASEVVGIMEDKIDDCDGTVTLKGFELINIRYR